MSREGKIAIALFAAAVLIGCALLIRNGLLSIAKEIRDKPWPRVPEAVNVRELTVRQATIEAGRSATNGTNNVRITIENMKVDAQLLQPKEQATVEGGRSATNGTNNVRITIENMKVDAQLLQPKGK